MKVESIALDYIKRVVKCATIGKIDNVAVEPGRIRGMDDNQSVFIFQTDNVPEFEFGSIGFNRLPTFTTRLDMVTGADKLSITANTDTSKDGSSFVRSLNFAAKGIKVDYRCANPAVIRAPKELVDSTKYEIVISPAAINYMARGMTAMSSDEIKIICDEDNTRFEIADVNGDVLTYEFDTTAVDITSSKPAEFEHTYPLKTLLPLLKAMDHETCYITKDHGMIRMSVEGLDMYIFPRTTT